ncbi:MAG: hypothetical protein IJ859_03035 [Synergistaceae bacterium]|nr:hypothetical protein [Synergistaceae bacterium]
MEKFLSSTAIVNELDRQDSSAKEKLSAESWQESRLERNGNSSIVEEARIFARTISIKDKYPEYFEHKSIEKLTPDNSGSKQACNIELGTTGSEATIMLGVGDARPNTTKEIKSLQDLDSVKAMRYDIDSLTIGFDTEYVNVNSGEERHIISYQFALYAPNDYEKIHEIIFLPVNKQRLSFWRMLSWILTKYNLCEAYDKRDARRWWATVKSGKRKKFKSPEEAYEKSVLNTEKALLLKQCDKPFQSEKTLDGGYIFDPYAFPKKNITLVCHFDQADLSTFKISKSEKEILDSDIIVNCSHIQGGLVSLYPICHSVKAVQKPNKFYHVNLNIRDTKCFAPAGQGSLKKLGEAISLFKLELPYDAIEHMDEYFKADPVRYFEYSINDSVICLMYSSELWGINKAMPITITAGAQKVAISTIKAYFNITDDDEFDLNYRGLCKKNYGKEKTSNARKFREKKSLEAVSDDAQLILQTSVNAYSGGFNGCFGVRYVEKLTHDYDLQQAYPTAMSCVMVPDWNSDNLIIKTIEKKLLTLDEFNSPCDLMFGDIEFEFPKNVLFPCIPINVNGCPIFPRTSAGLTKCYTSGPEMYLALKLGAKIKARRVYVVSQRIMPDSSPSKCLYKVAEQLVKDRQIAKDHWGSKSFEQDFIKMAINSLYGKTAQNIKPKSSWNAASSMMEEIGSSKLTSPVHACLTTSITRCILISAMNQLYNLGFNCYSVTTDGFISDAPFDTLNGLDLYGFGKIFRDSRMRLTGSHEMWEEKHTQSSFLNFSTRGNISQDENGVCARNGLHPSYMNDKYGEVDMKPGGLIDRYSSMHEVAVRTNRVCSHEKHFTGFKELSYHGGNLTKRKDFICEGRERHLRMDFDMKRKPLETSFEQKFFTVKGVTEEASVKGEPQTITLPDVPNCELMSFDSVPYENVDEYKKYRKVYDGMTCLRTKTDWTKFWLKIHAVESRNTHRRHVKNVDWSILVSCVMGHRLGRWKIPALSDPNKSVKGKVEWINKFNNSGKLFTESSWKNCRRKDRAEQIVSEEDCRELLERMIADKADKNV